MLIGLTQFPDKLLFTFVRLKMLSLRASAQDFRGNPPVRREMYRQLPYRVGKQWYFGGNRHLVRFNRGIATPVCGLVRNDRKPEGEAAKQQFVGLLT